MTSQEHRQVVALQFNTMAILKELRAAIVVVDLESSTSPAVGNGAHTLDPLGLNFPCLSVARVCLPPGSSHL
ncbi:hypothetical protein D1007_23386 [Hordeum vulgare]|nr:hypothetical protein D1007_23386 [Hordeum vulgare]